MEEWLTRAARERPDHPALVTAAETLTYAELDTAAARTARRLAAAGIGRGDVVATTLPAGRHFAELLHAVPRLGAVLAPLDPRSAAGVDIAALRVDAPLGGDEREVELRRLVDADAAHSVIHTSGTGGRPKPVELSYRNHHSSALACAELVGSRAEDRWLSLLPPFHVAGLAILIRAAVGAVTAVVHGRFEAQAARMALEAGEATLVSLVPTMLARLRDAGFERAPGLRALLLGGGPIPAELLGWARSVGLPVVPVYGMTETASLVAAGSPGEPVRGAELAVSDEGEILVRGPMASRGALASDGWVHSGDLGRLDSDGRLHVEGRLKELIVTGGENVSPSEVEDALTSHPAVADAGVVGLEDPEWGEALAGFVVLREPVAEHELIEHCRERLEDFKVPKSIEQVPGLPRTPAGKLLRDQILP